MRAAPYQQSAYRSQVSRRSRLASAVLAALVVFALLAALIWMGAIPNRVREIERTLATFDVMPGTPSPKPVSKVAKAQPVQTRSAPTPPPPKLPPLPKSTAPKMIVLSREDFAASDIGKLPARGDDPGAGKASANSASVYGPGDGPGGKTLYNAEWQREPTRAELAFYMPAKAEEGWGMIACQTIERNHVDNCRVLGESPGSGIGRGLRQAAWQFLVLPPRINGKPQIGAWVRIRFDLVRGVTK